MPKIILTVLLFFLFFTPIANAQLVQVCDLTVPNFYAKMNRELALAYTDHRATHTFDELSPPIEMDKNAAYISYMTVLKSGQQGAVVTLYANRAGYVSKITVMSRDDIKEALNLNFLATYVVMKALDLSDDEAKILIGNHGPHGSNAWCSVSNRRIFLEMSKQHGNIAYMRFTASDQ
ncbi:hypothetical protein [Selenomonas sp. ND2010]|uniref:hypothetical protein n=1 Tax=Selenomonas sp. ND2010 TaxID=1410618 RepID=UPI00051C5BDA|nr:hypothetical protein [Selenomonas sp. ND2010]